MLQLTICNKIHEANIARFVRLTKSLGSSERNSTPMFDVKWGKREARMVRMKGVEFCDAGVPVN